MPQIAPVPVQADPLAGLPFDRFSTTALAPRDQFDAWHRSISVVFDTVRPAGVDPRRSFHASVSAFHLGSIVLSQVEFESQHFVRTRQRAAADGLDHYLVQLYATGGLIGTADERERVLHAGDVQILDLSRANATRADASNTIALVVPRDALRQSLDPSIELHGLVLPAHRGVGGLLSDYLRSLFDRAGSISRADAAAVAQATTNIIAACFHRSPETLARARSPLEAMLLERIKLHVTQRLRASDLSPASICRDFQISRSQLYRLFEPLGGVAAWIQEQRLVQAHADLGDRKQAHHRIYDIAYALGFTSEAHFSRAFKQAFGLSPRDVRAGSTQPLATCASERQPGGQNATYDQWIRRLAPGR